MSAQTERLLDALVADGVFTSWRDEPTCSYSTVYGGERWCDTHDSTWPCPSDPGLPYGEVPVVSPVYRSRLRFLDADDLTEERT